MFEKSADLDLIQWNLIVAIRFMWIKISHGHNISDDGRLMRKTKRRNLRASE